MKIESNELYFRL